MPIFASFGSLVAQVRRLDADAFLVGNIAPDSGRPKSDGSGYDPPVEIAHLMRDGLTHAEAFRAGSLDATLEAEAQPGASRPPKATAAPVGPTCAVAARAALSPTASFLPGYYAHLLTDNR